jgi:hypothetical protein
MKEATASRRQSTSETQDLTFCVENNKKVRKI